MPNITVGWFPRYSPSGVLTAQSPGQWRNQWLSDGVEIHGNGVNLVINGAVQAALDGNELSAAGGAWAALRTDPVRVYTDDGRVFDGAGCPARSGADLAMVDDRQAAQKNLLLNGQIVQFGAITDVRLSTQALVWTNNGVPWGVSRLTLDPPQSLLVASQEFAPVPIDTPDGPWVLTHTQTGILLHPFGDPFGYRFDNGGNTYYPDGVYLPNGTIYVAFTDSAGRITEMPFPLSAPRSDLRIAPVIQPVFTFAHPCNPIYPFFAQGSGLPDIFTLGTYTESDVLPSPMPAGRIILVHDGEDAWTPPLGLRPFDLVGRECYLLPTETIPQSAARWTQQFQKLLVDWAGDVCVVPMMYDQQRWTVQQILDGLGSLSSIVNLSPRIKVIAPFAYNRANGILKYPELQTALWNLHSAAAMAGDATLTPITSVPTLERIVMQPFQGYAKIVVWNHPDPFYTGVDPSASSKVYYNRPGQPNAGGAWEHIQFTPHDDGGVDACYIAANVQLSVQPDGTMQTRPAGTYGAFENFQVRQENDGAKRLILYRTDLIGITLLVEVG